MPRQVSYPRLPAALQNLAWSAHLFWDSPAGPGIRRVTPAGSACLQSLSVCQCCAVLPQGAGLSCQACGWLLYTIIAGMSLAALQFLAVLHRETGRAHRDVKASQFFDELEDSDRPIRALDLGSLPPADAGQPATPLPIIQPVARLAPYSWGRCSTSATRSAPWPSTAVPPVPQHCQVPGTVHLAGLVTLAHALPSPRPCLTLPLLHSVAMMDSDCRVAVLQS